MYARVTTAPASPEQADAGIRAFREQGIPAFQRQPGFKGAFLLGDRPNGKAIAVSLWETEENAGAVTQAVADVAAQVTRDLKLAEPPKAEIYEVVFETPAQGAASGAPAAAARVITTQMPPEQVEPGLRAMREQGIPDTVYNQPGFRGAYFLLNRAAGKVLNISLWETQDALRATEAQAARVGPETARQYGVSTSLQYETYEVAAQT
jgi:heme-degrading monooxygenase HmoA